MCSASDEALEWLYELSLTHGEISPSCYLSSTTEVNVGVKFLWCMAPKHCFRFFGFWGFHVSAKKEKKNEEEKQKLPNLSSTSQPNYKTFKHIAKNNMTWQCYKHIAKKDMTWVLGLKKNYSTRPYHRANNYLTWQYYNRVYLQNDCSKTSKYLQWH